MALMVATDTRQAVRCGDVFFRSEMKVSILSEFADQFFPISVIVGFFKAHSDAIYQIGKVPVL